MKTNELTVNMTADVTGLALPQDKRADAALADVWIAAIVEEIPREYWPGWVFRHLLGVLPPVVALAARWRWSHIYDRVEQARRDGAIVTQPLSRPTFGIDEAGRRYLCAWVNEWLAGYVEASTAPLRQILSARQHSMYLETPIEIRERGSIIYSLAAVLRLGDMPSQSGTSAAHDLLRESTG